MLLVQIGSVVELEPAGFVECDAEPESVGLGLGFTGSVGKIEDLDSGHPTFERIITGLASSADAGGVVGPDGVSALGKGDIHIIMAESPSAVLAAHPHASPELAGEFG